MELRTAWGSLNALVLRVQKITWTNLWRVMADYSDRGGSMRLFTMVVRDTFQLDDGLTVFIGPLERNVKAIPPCDCEIIVKDEVKATIRIDGEMFLRPRSKSDRAISTSQRFDLASRGIGKAGFTIRSKR
jgi:hypothetical protein